MGCSDRAWARARARARNEGCLRTKAAHSAKAAGTHSRFNLVAALALLLPISRGWICVRDGFRPQGARPMEYSLYSRSRNAADGPVPCAKAGYDGIGSSSARWRVSFARLGHCLPSSSSSPAPCHPVARRSRHHAAVLLAAGFRRAGGATRMGDEDGDEDVGLEKHHFLKCLTTWDEGT